MKAWGRFGLGTVAAIALLVSCDDGPTGPQLDDPVDGIITAIVIDEGNPVFLVEEKPSESNEGQKLFFHIAAETEILIRLRSGLSVPGVIEDLTLGTRVRAWKGEIVTLSYPGATTAPRIEIVR